MAGEWYEVAESFWREQGVTSEAFLLLVLVGAGLVAYEAFVPQYRAKDKWLAVVPVASYWHAAGEIMAWVAFVVGVGLLVVAALLGLDVLRTKWNEARWRRMSDEWRAAQGAPMEEDDGEVRRDVGDC